MSGQVVPEVGQRVRQASWVEGVYLDVEWVERSEFNPDFNVCGTLTRGHHDYQSKSAVRSEPDSPWIVINAACQTCRGTGLIGVRYPGEYGGEIGAGYDTEPCPDCDRACEFCGEQKAKHTDTERSSCIADGATPWGES